MDGERQGPGIPLVVDMDGTLLATDTLVEAALAFVAAAPSRALGLIGWLRLGKAGFKRRLADAGLADPSALPVRPEALAAIEAARAEGRRVVLVSAADERQVQAGAAHLGLFDEAHGTGPGTSEGANLSGAAKAAFLVARYGERGFDYMGDSGADLAVWAHGRRAVTVGAPASLRAGAERLAEAEHIAPPPAGLARIAPYLRAMRPHQWVKNLLVFVPAVASHDLAGLGTAAVAFAAFSLVASAVYLVNDMLDLAADRAHPRKRNRPFAAGAIPLIHGVILAPALMLSGALIAGLLAPPLLLGVLAVYTAVTFAYSLALKRMLIIDIWTLAGLYTIRLLAGAAAVSVVPSPWLTGFSMFLFLSLAAVKRQAELVSQAAKAGPDGAQEIAGRAYRLDDLPVVRGMALAAGYAAVVVFSLYINSEAVIELYARPEWLWPLVAVLLYWISRMVMVTHRGGMTDDPILFAALDRQSHVCGAVCLASLLVAAGALG